MTYGWMLLAFQIALIGPEPMKLSTGMNCVSLQIRAKENVTLTRLCSEAAYLRNDADGADTACHVSMRQLTELGPSIRAALELPPRERQACLTEIEFRNTMRAMDFNIAFMQFRRDGSVSMPNPFHLEE